MKAYLKSIERWGRWLRWSVPLLAWPFRHWAIRQLTRFRDQAEAIMWLVWALSSADRQVAIQAEQALRSLTAQPAVDALCTLWIKDRDKRLGRLIAECRYIAAQPVELRVLSGLKAGRLEKLRATEAEAVPALVQALADWDSVIAQTARIVLGSLKAQPAVDALIDRVLDDPKSAGLMELINCRGYRHSVEGRWFLYLVLAGRFDEYLKEDFEFQVLRPEFRAATPQLQARIREVIVQRGDVRMNPLFASSRRETVLAELSDHDADVLVRINSRNRNWDELFKFLWVLPARHIRDAVWAMQQAGWQPADADRAALFQRLARLVEELGEPPEAGRATRVLPTVLQSWLEFDTAPKWEPNAPPPQQIAALGALQRAGKLDADTLAQAARSEHWLVRLAALALDSTPPSTPDTRPSTAVNDGGKEWFDRLAPLLDAQALWGLKPCQVTRDGLEALQEGLSRMKDRRAAGGLNLLEAVVAHYTAHDIEIEAGARVVISEDSFEIEG
jgi:hypothetical protein